MSNRRVALLLFTLCSGAWGWECPKWFALLFPLRRAPEAAPAPASTRPVPAKVERPPPAVAPGPSPAEIAVNRRIAESQDPHHTSWALTHPESAELDPAAVRKLFVDYQEIVGAGGKPARIAERLSKWITSDEHTLYVAQNLKDFGANALPVLEHLVRNNPERFKGTEPIRGGAGFFVTSSYDIEEPGEPFTLLYRTKDKTDDQWLALPVAARIKLYLERPKDLVPTAMAPSFPTKLSLEGGGGDKPPDTELKHPSYEIQLTRTLQKIRDLASIKGNTHSIHLHLNAEFPESYPHMRSLQGWHHQRQNYLTFQGLEEALVPARSIELTRSGIFKASPGWTDLEAKKLTLGIRTNVGPWKSVFSESTVPGHVKLDLELRDSTRDLDKLESTARKIAGELRARPWEGADFNPSQLLNLNQANTQQELARAGVPADVAKLIAANSPLGAIPLIDYSNARFYDFAAKRWKKPGLTAEESRRLQKAREKYVASLQQMVGEIRDIAKKPEGERAAYHSALAEAVAMDVVAWAKEAQVSKLFPDDR